jgi:hypothetical protein
MKGASMGALRKFRLEATKRVFVSWVLRSESKLPLLTCYLFRPFNPCFSLSSRLAFCRTRKLSSTTDSRIRRTLGFPRHYALDSVCFVLVLL